MRVGDQGNPTLGSGMARFMCKMGDFALNAFGNPRFSGGTSAAKTPFRSLNRPTWAWDQPALHRQEFCSASFPRVLQGDRSLIAL